MLNKDAKDNIKLIRTIAMKIWGDNVEFGDLKVLNSPYPEFEWIMKLFSSVDILLIYDRSTLEIGVPQNGHYVLLSEFTQRPFFRGLESTQPNNLFINFQVLNDVVVKMCHN